MAYQLPCIQPNWNEQVNWEWSFWRCCSGFVDALSKPMGCFGEVQVYPKYGGESVNSIKDAMTVKEESQ